MACRALALRSLLLPDPLHRLPAAPTAPPAARTPRGGRRPHLRCCSGGGGDPGQPPQEAVLEAISKVARSKGRVALTTNMVMGGTVTDDASDEWLVLDQKGSSPSVAAALLVAREEAMVWSLSGAKGLPMLEALGPPA